MAAQTGDSESLLNQADSMWKMLDDLVESDPEAYKRFMEKTLKEGSTMFKPPEPCFCVITVLVSVVFSVLEIYGYKVRVLSRVFEG